MIKYLLFLVIVILVTGCSQSQKADSIKISDKTTLLTSPTPTIAEENFAKEWKIKFDKTAAELERNRNLWKQKNIRDYDFVVSKMGGGNTNEWNGEPVLIKIRAGNKISIEKTKEDTYLYSRTDGFEDFDTIAKLFDYLQQELEKGRILDIEYHKKLGYPKGIAIQFNYEIHGWVSISVEKLKIIEKDVE